MATIDYKQKIKDYMNSSEVDTLYKSMLNNLFPELKENEDEDERIRKHLIGVVELYYGNTDEQEKKDCLAWLEKQGRKKAIMNVPPREVILSIWDLGNEWKGLTNGSISTEYGTQLDYIQKHWEESEYYLREKQREKKPADKVEPMFHIGNRVRYKGHKCDGIITEITDTDYICGNTKLPISTQDNLELVEQNHAWSKEDELSCFESALFTAFSDAWQSYLIGEEVNVKQWAKEQSKELLEAAKEEMKGHNSVWSEEDENRFRNLVYLVEHSNESKGTKEGFVKFINRLKALKDRITWKPSEKQMEALLYEVNAWDEDSVNGQNLKSLYEQLKKLREE